MEQLDDTYYRGCTFFMVARALSLSLPISVVTFTLAQKFVYGAVNNDLLPR